MRLILVILGMAAGIIALADGLAMTLPGPSSAFGGALLFAGGCAWATFALPRILDARHRRYSSVIVSVPAVVLPPLLYLPIQELWRVATPAALNGWFSVAWGTVWLVALVSYATIGCPACERSFHRAGVRVALHPLRCTHCGAGPFIGNNQRDLEAGVSALEEPAARRT